MYQPCDHQITANPGFRLFFLLVFFISAAGFFGCTVTTRTVQPDEEVHYDEEYDFSDKKKIVDSLVSSLRQVKFIDTSSRPVVVVYGVQNRTSEHISTKLITDDIREALMETGQFRFINKQQRENIAKETDYQYGGAVDPTQRVLLAKQAGAKYMLTGTLYSIEKEEPKQVRLKKKTLNYYKLHLELTDLESGLVEWTKGVEIIREASKPFIGW